MRRYVWLPSGSLIAARKFMINAKSCQCFDDTNMATFSKKNARGRLSAMYVTQANPTRPLPLSLCIPSALPCWEKFWQGKPAP